MSGDIERNPSLGPDMSLTEAWNASADTGMLSGLGNGKIIFFNIVSSDSPLLLAGQQITRDDNRIIVSANAPTKPSDAKDRDGNPILSQSELVRQLLAKEKRMRATKTNLPVPPRQPASLSKRDVYESVSSSAVPLLIVVRLNYLNQP